MVRFPIICRLLALYNTLFFSGVAYALLKDLIHMPPKHLDIGLTLFLGITLIVIIISNLFSLSDGESNPVHWIFLIIMAVLGAIALFAPHPPNEQAAMTANDFLLVLFILSPILTTILMIIFGKPEYRRPIYRSNNGPYTQPNSDAYN